MISSSQINCLGFDVGSKRIGVARANMGVRFAGPLMTLQNPETFVADIVDLCRSEAAAVVVFGLPRSLNGVDTRQTDFVHQFVAQVKAALAANGQTVRLYCIDEALTSVRAEAELANRPKNAGSYAKTEVDALAATYILDDFLKEHKDV